MKLAPHYWVAVTPGGMACEGTVSTRRSLAIDQLIRRYGDERRAAWRRFYGAGWRIAKVRIVELNGKVRP